MDADTIRMNVEQVRENIEKACARSGRKADDVTLMAVTKTKPRELADAAYDAGIRVFGENRVQEAESKYAEFYPEGELHLIGHLQSNKAKPAAKVFSWVQSIDKLKTAKALDKQLRELGTRMNILLEINTSGEESKYGYLSKDAFFRDIDAVLELDTLVVRGLMTIGPLTPDSERVRAAFRSLRKTFDETVSRYPELNIDTLSMGMSGDYESAIEEGSTLVRVGTTLFGARG